MVDIYLPHEDSDLLAMNVRRFASGKVLDMGTGSGIQALAAIECEDVEHVTAVDVNPHAVSSLKSLIMDLDSISPKRKKMIDVFQSDMFSSVDGLFDTIICNPPYLPDDPDSKDVALDGGIGGFEWSMRFLEGAKRNMAPNGKIIFLFSNLTNKERIDSGLDRLGYSYEQVSELHVGFFEVLYVYVIRANGACDVGRDANHADGA